MYLSGYLRRDPSLGNILMLSVEKKKVFEIPEEFLSHLSTLENKEENKKKNEEVVEKIKENCEAIRELVVKMEIPNNPCAVIEDGDLAVAWEEYLGAGRRKGKSVSRSPVF